MRNRSVKIPIITDWIAWTPTGTWTTNTTYTGFYKRDGSCLSVDIQIALAGAPTSTTLQVNLPVGFVINTALMTSSVATSTPLKAQGQLLDFGTNSVFIWADFNDSTSFNVVCGGSGSTDLARTSVNATTPITFAANDRLRILISNIPILGWKTFKNVVL